MTDPVPPSQPRPVDWLLLLPHRPPMRLVEQVLDVRPGESARCSRTAHPDDWYFQGHFPEVAVVPAIVLVELLAQTGGLAAASRSPSVPEAAVTAARVTEAAVTEPIALRVAAFGGFKFPRAAGPGARLEATARVAGRMGGLYKIEGEVTADGQVVASGSLTLAEARR